MINILLSASQNEAPLRSEAVRWLVKIRGLEVVLKFSGNASGLSVSLRSSLFRFLSVKRESRDDSRTEVTKN